MGDPKLRLNFGHFYGGDSKIDVYPSSTFEGMSSIKFKENYSTVINSKKAKEIIIEAFSIKI